MKNEAAEIIKMLEKEKFYAECPCCGEPVLLRDAGLFYLGDFSPEALDLYRQNKEEAKSRRQELRRTRKLISERSERTAASVNIGFILERLAPTMNGFRFSRTDCRSLFDPIDYVIFEGLSYKGRVSRLVFADVKTGASRLTNVQKELKSLVERKKVNWDIYEQRER